MANFAENVGKATLKRLDYLGSLTVATWDTFRALGTTVPTGNRYRWKASIVQMLQIGVEAVPMVALMAMCCGFILAMQGGYELRRIGAMSLTIDLVAIGFTREIGPLLTAIAVCGRSGSAFSAEIGTMVVTQEIDTLKVMAFNPIEFVVAPKLLAALITVPCLTVACNACGIFAGWIFMFFSTHLGLKLYVHDVFESLVLRDVVSGFVKSLAFAVIIVLVGCLEGFHVQGGPEAVGRATTTAVVRSTFLVIVADMVFTAIFYFTGKH
jgi:phospholipid/cholesterol/gamma-HCH transport system permease protein